MSGISLKDKLSKFMDDNLFYDKWQCSACGKEIFNDKYFCEECDKNLPRIDGYYCNHCGRMTESPEEYCLTCKNVLTSMDLGRSVFNYDGAIKDLIRNFKYDNKQYLSKMFSEFMANVYFKSGFTADLIVYVPMTERELNKRGYNQTELLANDLSEIINVPVMQSVQKIKETEHQAELGREERLKNLVGVFHVNKRKNVRGKSVLIVDDVTTTGATGEALASKIKSAGATKVMLLTIASVAEKK